MKIKSISAVLYDAGTVAAGALLFSMSLNMFLLPGGIILGGFTGVATLFNLYLGLPIGAVIIALNLPLVLINTKLYGIRFLTKTIVGITATSLASDFITAFPVTFEDPLLCALFGGVTMGIACGLLFARGFTTGGTDLVAWLVKYKWRQFSTGRLIFAADAVIILAAALFMRSYEGVFYSAITIYLSSKLVDFIMEGERRARMVYIISDRREEIRRGLLEGLERGVTVLRGQGGYTGSERDVLMCVVRPQELFKLKECVRAIDPDAFIVACEVSEVQGEGFTR